MGQTYSPDNAVCSQVIYSDLQDSGKFTVWDSYEDPDKMGSRAHVEGSGVCDSREGKCWVSKSWFNDWGEPNYDIIDTDYKSYSIVHNCDYYGESLTFLTRDPVPPPQLF